MREIKFRAWNSEEKRMFYSKDDKERNWFSIGMTWEMHNDIKKNICVSSKDILMQFTGLKDKNGKEIYEGDILRCEDIADGSFSTGYDYFGEVVYQGKHEQPYFSHCFTLRALDRGTGKFHCVYLEKAVRLSEGEVIGNIYENPELLEEKK
jgi:uncharacterized phage protein (TIGR01671 family)